MSVSIHTTISSIPKEELKRYFDANPVEFKEEPDWSQEEKELHKQLNKLIKGLSHSAYEPLHIDFERIAAFANDKGIAALINASEKPEELEETFKSKANHHHMAMSCFLDDTEHFKTAEELILVDFKAEGQGWKHCKIQTKATVDSFSEEDANAFAYEVANVFYRNFDAHAECCGEVYRRHHDDTLQISVYVNSLPNSDIRVEDRQLKRIDTKRAIVSAVVYDPKTHHFFSVAPGGKGNHEKIQQAFAKTILKEESVFTEVTPRQFNLEAFRERPKEGDILFTHDPKHKIEKVRLRRIDVYSSSPHLHSLSIDTFSQEKNSDIYDNKAIFKDGRLFDKYKITGVEITFHFYPEKEGKKGKALHVTIRKDSSTAKNLNEEKRQMVENYFKKWKLVDES